MNQIDARELATVYKNEQPARSINGEHAPHVEGLAALSDHQQRSRTSPWPGCRRSIAAGVFPCAGKQSMRRVSVDWLAKITEVGVLRPAEFYYQHRGPEVVLRHEYDGSVSRE